MKRIHIIGIILIALAIGVIVVSMNDASTYASFTEAIENPDKEYHVVGKLNKDKETIYNPQADPNLFVFYMTDMQGQERKVLLHKSKPQDFERSEQIVVIGKAKGDTFDAADILMKCPSKYNDGQPGQ